MEPSDARVDGVSTTGRAHYEIKAVHIGLRSRAWVQHARLLFRPLMHWLWGAAPENLIEYQRSLLQLPRRLSAGIPQRRETVGGVPTVLFGHWQEPGQPVVLYLHGGGFCLPAVPQYHHGFLSRLCSDLGALGLMPDYRLSPQHRFPAALDDCEQVYRALLDRGLDARRVVLVGESAGGTLTLALLQRLRRHGLPMPACAVPISAGTDLTEVDALLSRRQNAGRDPVLPRRALAKAIRYYAAGLDRRHPEISPAYGEFHGFPPLYFLVAENELLLDDTLVCAEKARAAGIETQLDVWPVLPHAFPLLARLLPEARQARRDIASFLSRHLMLQEDAPLIPPRSPGASPGSRVRS